MEVLQLIFILFHLLPVFTSSDVVSASSEGFCQTPSVCKSLTECPPLLKVLKQAVRRYNHDLINSLQKSQCGFDGIYAKVCCPNDVVNNTSQTNDTQLLPNNTQLLPNNSQLLPNNSTCGYFFVNKIYMGQQTSRGEYPWTVWLRYNSAGGQKEISCGGVLISERYVLTAAHCIKGPHIPNNSKVTTVRLKEHDSKTNPDCDDIDDLQDCNRFVDVPVQETIVHEDYDSDDPNQYHDIALIRLEKPVVFDDFAKPICLFEKVQRDPDTTKYVSAGWGIDINQVRYTTKIKNFVTAKDATICEAAFKVKLSQNQMCTGVSMYTDWCARDSGGSLMSDRLHYAVGVMSFGSCSTEGRLAVYTRVDQYKNWIVSKLKQ